MNFNFIDEDEDFPKREFQGNEQEFTLWGVIYVARPDPSQICEGCHFSGWSEACANAPACSDKERKDERSAIFVPKHPEQTFVKTMSVGSSRAIVENGKKEQSAQSYSTQ